MPGELGESQLSSLLESVPGLASVLRSPVADAIVNMIRAAAGLRDFELEEAQELVQYATRRGLIPQKEGSDLLDEVTALASAKRSKKAASKPRVATKKPPATKQAKAVKTKTKAKAPVRAPTKKFAEKKKKAPSKPSKGRTKDAKAAKKKRR